MKQFLNIIPVYKSNNDRSISALKKVYQDDALLRQKIEDVIKVGLSSKNIEGKKVLLKPNWVKHSSNEEDEICLRTHDNFLLATLKVILEFRPSGILIGDAPIQGCIWDKVVSPELVDRVNGLSQKYGIDIFIKDFRRVTFEPSKNNPVHERNPISDYLIFNLGKESFLEPITQENANIFRVTNYNPDRMKESHSPGIHKYCITKDLFSADIVISLPKIKTHQKTGITAALKNIVGLNGDKDFLPHHRIGGTGFGGDCYPGKNYLRYWSELSLDFANRHQGKSTYWIGYKYSSLLWKLSLPGPEHTIAAAWHGNDTTWRMVMDLNKIVLFGKVDGGLSDKPQRQLYSLSDGIIGGQGDGPLHPKPLPLGVIAFTNNSALHDVAMAQLMGFNPEAIPLLSAVSHIEREVDAHIFWNSVRTDIRDLNRFSVNTLPPPGWKSHLK